MGTCTSSLWASKVAPIYSQVARDDDMEGDSLDDGGSESSWETLDGEDPDEETAPAAPELAEHAAVSLRWQIEEAIEAEAELLV